jgi:hypothetical protein
VFNRLTDIRSEDKLNPIVERMRSKTPPTVAIRKLAVGVIWRWTGSDLE